MSSASKKKKVLALIPTRGGSKGMPSKNIIDVQGKPLIAHTIGQARGSKLISKVVVATDDRKIASLAKKYRADVIILPGRLTGDRSPVTVSALYALAQLERNGEKFDAVALLEPTSPLRKKDDVDKAVGILLKNYKKTDAVVSVGEVHLESPYIMKRVEKGRLKPLMAERNIPRQLLPKVYFPYGVVYLCKTAVLKKQKTFYPKRIMPYLIARWQNYEIDDIFDLVVVRALMAAMRKK